MPETTPPPNSIQGFESGSLAHEIRQQLQQVVSAIRSTGKAGGLTLKLSITPQGAHQMRTKASISTNIPQPDRMEELWYDDGDGNLTRRDPRQPTLDEALAARSLEE